MFDEIKMKTNELSKKKLMKVVMCEVCNVSKDEYACKKYFITKWMKMIMITKQIENLESE